jgi:aspartyl-tRNA(Asn)/glutamyl-tRNA(Gln) amidotransferase subunit B
VAPAAVALHVERGLDTLALAAMAAGADPARVLNHVEHNLAVDGAHDLDAGAFAELVAMEIGGELTATQAKAVLADMVTSGRSARDIASERGFEAMDTSELDSALDAVIAEFADDWAAFCAADDPGKRKKLTGFFTGKVMAATHGRADGRAVGEALTRRAAG